MILNLIKSAIQLLYDNSKSGLKATNVQGAIDEVQGNVEQLNTNVQNAIDEVQENISALSANVIKPSNLKNYICYKDFSYDLAASNWTKSANGQYYYNIPNSNIGKTVISCYISFWQSTANHVTVTYNNTYGCAQLLSNVSGIAKGTVRVVYLNE